MLGVSTKTQKKFYRRAHWKQLLKHTYRDAAEELDMKSWRQRVQSKYGWTDDECDRIVQLTVVMEAFDALKEVGIMGGSYARPKLRNPEYCGHSECNMVIQEEKRSKCLCREIYYCSRACQKADWPRHKTECKWYENKLRVGGQGCPALP